MDSPARSSSLARALSACALITLVTGCGGGDAPSGDPGGAAEAITPVAIRNVTVIDAENGVREALTVVVRGDEIVAVADGAAVPDGAEVLDGTGKFLIPGLWDMHVHLTYDDAFTEAMPALFLSYGITSVRDTGGLLEKLLPVVERMRAEGAVAPRVFFSGPLLDGKFVVYDGDGRPEIGTENPSVDAARANVAALAEAGVDFIKVYEMVTPEVFEALVEAGAEHGLPIAGHVPLSLRASQAAPRLGSMEHLRNVEMDCAAGAEALLAERRAILDAHEEGPGGDLRSRLHGLQRLPAVADHDPARCREVIATMTSTVQVPTLRLNAMGIQPPYLQPDWLEGLDRAPEEAVAQWRAFTEQATADGAGSAPLRDNTFGEWSLDLVRRMHEQGVPIGAGTDTPIGFALPGYSLHDELAMLVRAGLSPLEALHSATLRPAEFLGLEGQMGTVEPGRRADLVLLTANPLDDIANTKAIEAVVSKGRVFRPSALVSGEG